MHKNHQGFTLIELVIAIALSSIVALALYTGFWQTRRTVTNLLNIINDDMSLAVIYHQLERDLMGAFIPDQGMPQKKEPAQAELQQTETKEAAEKKEEPKAKAAEQKKLAEKKAAEQKEQRPLIKKVFYATGTPLLQQLTFISHNPLTVYTDPRQATGTVRLVRIMYTLEPDKETPGTYRLYRQESTELEAQKFADTKKIRRYELARNIQRISLSYIYEEAEEPPKKQAAQAEKAVEKIPAQQKPPEKPKPKRFLKANVWSTDERIEKNEQILLPSFIEVLMQPAGLAEPMRFVFALPVISYQRPEPSATPQLSAEPVKPPEQKEAESKKAQDKTTMSITIGGTKT